METVFITIHDLSPDARIKYCSNSIEDILGYLPHEVKGKSCWEYFHPDEVPFAKLIHGKGIGLDKAAVFNYCRVRHKDGSWVGCECVFTIVYDVLIASTAIYQHGAKSQKRAHDGAYVRRIFSSDPRDPRYHMLAHISTKFDQAHIREPRAAFFLNRFSRTSTIMFATNGVADILGLSPQQLVGRSFYYCIARNCLDEAIRCLESAKANDSLAYLRFWYRDPTREPLHMREDSIFTNDSGDEDEDGGVSIGSTTRSSSELRTKSCSPITESDGTSTPVLCTPQDGNDYVKSIADSTPRLDVLQDGSKMGSQLLLSSNQHMQPGQGATLCQEDTSRTPSDDEQAASTFEIEAVVSCTSDGLVVVLRRARSLPSSADCSDGVPYFPNGLFASPWAMPPVLPATPNKVDPIGDKSNFAEPGDTSLAPELMDAIRDVAAFAWSLTSINGSLIEHSHGEPTGEALPPGGLPVWDSNANVDEKENDKWNGFATSTHRRIEDLDANLVDDHKPKEASPEKDSSDDEILWKRVPQQPPWRPRRRAFDDAFNSDAGVGIESDSTKRNTGSLKSRKRRIGD